MFRKKYDNIFKIKVEMINLLKVKEANACRADRIILDNMSNDLMKVSVKIISKGIEI